MNRSMPMSMHDDVMKASPEDDAGKERLFGALKDRAASEFKNKRLDCALQLYTQALKFATAPAQHCVVHSNLSLTHTGMKNGQAALTAADASLAVDATFAKGHFRRGQALVVLNRIPESHSAFEKAAELEPETKMFTKGVRLSAKRLAAYVPDLDPAHTAAKQQAAPAPALPKAPAAAPATARAAAKAPTPAPAAAATGTSANPTKSSATKQQKKPKEGMRGYKVVNGKKTSYFHHEMTEEEKRLIGDITPQRIDPSAQDATAEPAAVVEGMSKWNSKGTFEDRDMLPWAKQQLPSLLEGQSVPCGSCDIRITAVKEIGGLCSIAFIQKRKRFLFELNLTLEWEAQASDPSAPATENGGGAVSVSKGSLKLEQLCHDDEDGDDLVPKYTTTKAAAGKSDAEAIKRSVSSRRGDFFTKVAAQLQEFRRQFFAL